MNRRETTAAYEITRRFGGCKLPDNVANFHPSYECSTCKHFFDITGNTDIVCGVCGYASHLALMAKQDTNDMLNQLNDIVRMHGPTPMSNRVLCYLNSLVDA